MMEGDLLKLYTENSHVINQIVASVATDLSIFFLWKKDPKKAVIAWLVAQPFWFACLWDLKIMFANQIFLTLNWTRWFYNYYIVDSKFHRNFQAKILRKKYPEVFEITEGVIENIYNNLTKIMNKVCVDHNEWWRNLSFVIWEKKFYFDEDKIVDAVKLLPKELSSLHFGLNLDLYRYFDKDLLFDLLENLPDNLRDLAFWATGFETIPWFDMDVLIEMVNRFPVLLESFEFRVIDIFKMSWSSVDKIKKLFNSFNNSLKKVSWFSSKEFLEILVSLPSSLEGIAIISWNKVAEVYPWIVDYFPDEGFYNSIRSEYYDVKILKRFASDTLSSM